MTKKLQLITRSSMGLVMTLLATHLSHLAFGQEDSVRLAEQAFRVLEQKCATCHGPPQTEAGLTITDFDQLLQPKKTARPAYVVPGKPEESLVWIRANEKRDMPPDYEDAAKYPPLTDDERKILDEWIRKGAPEPRADRRPVSDIDVLKSIKKHLEEHRHDAPFLRYFVFAVQHNNLKVRDRTLEIYRAALSKLLNSLQWRGIVYPEPIDTEQIIFVIDLRDIGWSQKTWHELKSRYPYSIRHTNDDDTLELEKEIEQRSHERLTFVRGDWFIATASRAPLYDQLIGLPGTLQELEYRLGINMADNFKNDSVRRAGFVTSGVSRHNRMVERHVIGKHEGAYWRSYDFRSSDGKGNLVQYPLGPASLHKTLGSQSFPFEKQAFEQAGGEVIFNLPNGLQAYMLADDLDKRLDAPGPIDIVRDLKESAGNPTVVNGLSCMSCHREGMRSFRDAIRENSAVTDKALAKVKRLYVTQAQMEKLLEEDRRRYVQAEARATGRYFGLKEPHDEAAVKEIMQRSEPIAYVARDYLADLSPEVVAAELGLSNRAELEAHIKINPRLQNLGLGPLLALHGLKRELWERPGVSLFQVVAQEVLRCSID